MESIFSKNGILAGRLDYYCLICDTNFTTQDEVLVHILDSIHKETLKTCGYVEKYKNNFIRKTKGIYFCEPCSLTIPTAPKVELHIEEVTHLSKTSEVDYLNRVKGQIIAFNKFVISIDAWNGCIEDTCVLCSKEFDDAASHWLLRSHVLNLIKSKVVFDEFAEAIYRMIDDTSTQCLTCNELIGNDLASHTATEKHKKAYQLFDATLLTDTTQTCETPTETQNGKVNDKADKKDDNTVVYGNVNGDNNKEAVNNAKKDVKQDKDVKKYTKKESAKSDKEKVKQTVKKENTEELDKIYCRNLGAKNYVTNQFGQRWCILCERLLEESSEDHLKSKHHQSLLKLHKDRVAGTNNNSNDDEESIPYESVARYQKSNINIDLIYETAYCKKCSKNIDFSTSAIDKHIEEHKKTSSKKAPETLASGIKSNGTEKTTLYTKPVLLKQKRSPKTVPVGEYAKQHGFTHNVADCSYYCRPCSRRLKTTLEDLQKHVASKIHMENTKQLTKTEANDAPIKEPLFTYIKTFELVNTMTEGCIIVINDKFWLNAFGFFLIARKNERIFCHGCHIDLTQENVVQHVMVTDYHRGIIDKCLLITSLENEFIREIKLDVYHCGYCNITENDWDDIVDHIATAEHKREKAKAEESLSQHQPNFYHRTSLREIDDMVRQFVRHNP